jgi:hypothetical protein
LLQPEEQKLQRTQHLPDKVGRVGQHTWMLKSLFIISRVQSAIAPAWLPLPPAVGQKPARSPCAMATSLTSSSTAMRCSCSRLTTCNPPTHHPPHSHPRKAAHETLARACVLRLRDPVPAPQRIQPCSEAASRAPRCVDGSRLPWQRLVPRQGRWRITPGGREGDLRSEGINIFLQNQCRTAPHLTSTDPGSWTGGFEQGGLIRRFTVTLGT